MWQRREFLLPLKGGGGEGVIRTTEEERAMVNRQRGEVEAVLDGRTWTLCLTLGALAELEAALDAGDLMGLARRFGEGRLAANDAIRVIGAGLRGAGNEVSDAEVAHHARRGRRDGLCRHRRRTAGGDLRRRG